MNLSLVLVLYFKNSSPGVIRRRLNISIKSAYNILLCGVLSVMGQGRDKSSDNTEPDTSRQNPPYHSEILK